MHIALKVGRFVVAAVSSEEQSLIAGLRFVMKPL